jgi:hypothetical protein
MQLSQKEVVKVPIANLRGGSDGFVKRHNIEAQLIAANSRAAEALSPATRYQVKAERASRAFQAPLAEGVGILSCC